MFKSTDGGASWVFSSRGISSLFVTSVAVDPQTPTTLWVVANLAVFKSTDRGQTWLPVRLNPVAGGAVATQVLVDPLHPSNVYVLFSSGLLQRSHDGGQTWEAAGNPGNLAWKLVIDPRTPATLYAAGEGIAKSTDGGTTWAPLPVPPFDLTSVDLAISPSSPSTLYESGADLDIDIIVPRLRRTTDGGATWAPAEAGPRMTESLAVDPHVSTTVYRASEDGIVYRLTDGGAPGRSSATISRISGPISWPC